MSTELNALITVAFDGEQAISGLDATTASTTTLDDALARLQAVLDGVAGSMDAFAGSIDGLSADIDAASASLVGNTAALEANAGASRAAMGGQASLMRMSRMLLLPLGLAAAAVIGIGAAALSAETKYTSAMSTVQALTGQSAKTMVYLNAQVMQMATTLGQDPTQLSQGLYYVLSAGVHSATQAIAELKVVTMASAASFVDAQTDANALTSIMNAYSASTSQATYYQDVLLEGVVQGKTTMQQYGTALGLVGAYASKSGYNVAQAASALSTMTLVMPTARRAGTDLAALMRQLGINTDTVAKYAKGMGLSFNEAQFKSMGLYQQLQYLKEITHGNTAELMKLTGGATGFLAYSILMTKGGENFNYILDKMKGASGMLAKAWQVHTQTIGYQFDQLKANLSVALIDIGKAIQPVAVAVMKDLVPALKQFGAWVTTHGPEVAKIFATLAAVLTGGFVVALTAAVVGFVAMNATLALVVVGVMAMAGAVAFLALHWKQVTTFLAPLINGFKTLMALLAPIGEELRTQVGDVFATLGQTMRTSLIPAWNELKPTLIELKPILIVLAVILGGLLVTAIGVAVGALVGLVRGFGALMSGVIQIVGGLSLAVGSIFKALTDLVGGAFELLGDILHGHWVKFNHDATKLVTNLKDDVLNILKGLWEAIQGLFQATIGTVLGLVSGFVDGIAHFFDALFQALVGHSIVPDMVEAILKSFMDMETRGLAIIGRMLSTMVTNMASGGAKMMQALANALAAGANVVGNIVSNIAGKIAGFFPHSPAKEGPLVGWEHVGSHMMDMLANDMQSAQATIARSVQNIAGSVATGSGLSGAGTPGGSSTNTLLQSILNQLRSSGVVGPGAGAGTSGGTPNTMTNNWGGLTFNGVQNVNALMQAITQLQGLATEMGARGMTSGIALQ